MAIATALAVGGLAVAAGGSAMSFIQAGKQRNLQLQAQKDAADAMAQARKSLDVNYFNALSVNKEPYELQRQALLSQGAQAIEAGQEQGRGSAETAGRVQMAMNDAQSGIRTAMGNDMTTIQNKQLGEDGRLRDVGVQIDLAKVQGSQIAAQNAAKQQAADMKQGFQGLQNVGQQAIGMANLYPSKGSDAETATPNAGQWANGNAPLDWVNNITNQQQINVPYGQGQNANTPVNSPYAPLPQNQGQNNYLFQANPFLF